MNARLVMAAVLAALAVAGCGESEAQKGNAVDRAFASQMVPHHEMAVMMARMGDGRAKRTEVKKLLADVIRTQTAEINQLKAIAKDLGAEAAHASDSHKMDGGHMMHGGSEELGLSSDEMGMSMNMGALQVAKDFDREFVKQMIPHHEGAIRMAEVQLKKGSDERLNTLARQIIAAQTREIDQMRGWLKSW